MTTMNVYTIHNGKYHFEKRAKNLESLQEVVLNLIEKDVKPENIIISDGYDLQARFMDRLSL